jgi:hypothetical protein
MRPSEELPTTPWPDSTPAEGGDLRRLAPGVILEHRYRIVAPIARGGMGVLYRADDLRLGQRVALKFLSPDVAHDPRVVARLISEVRLGRQIAHPNVCRLYDLVDLDGHPCIAMEFVEGEDLASLLRRVGRLPAPRALEVARDLLAGLAAAHEQGVIHRDLKPANVMIDSRGKVKITDFGLAASTEEVLQKGMVIGTPGYMAPEQLLGEEITPLTDLYSLGLVLFEMFTGHRVFNAPSLSEMLALQRSAPRLPAPSSLLPEIDPRIERLITQCLENDPHNRPASARAALAMIPGGDPLSAAVEAGQTPSPEAVAAAESSGSLSLPRAWLALGTIIVATTVAVLWSESSIKLRILDRLVPPEALRLRAAQIAGRWLPHGSDQTTAWGYEQNEAYLAHLERTNTTASRWSPVYADPSTAIRFWYRRGVWLEPWLKRNVAFDDPPHRAGTIAVRLDGAGNLRSFRAPAGASTARTPVDWSRFFRDAGLDAREFQPVPPASPPVAAADEVRAWKRSRDELSIVAGSLHNAPVFFDVRSPWDVNEVEDDGGVGAVVFGVVWLLMSVAGVYMARRNVNQGRGDTRTAWRLASFVFVTWTLTWLFTAWSGKVVEGIAYGVLAAAEAWLLYLALEPHVRRRWPRVLVGWTRLFAGRFRDPQVGRDILIGFAFAAGSRVVLNVLNAALLRLDFPEPRPTAIHYYETAARAVGEFFYDPFLSVVLGLAFLFLLLVVGVAVKRLWIAVTIIATLIVIIFVPAGAGVAVLVMIVPIIVLVRFGLLAAVFSYYGFFLQGEILTFAFSRWYGGYSLVALSVMLGLSLFAFRTALSGRRLLPGV